MSKLRLDLKVYIDKYGNQYQKGIKNVLFPIYKLSNNVYRLYLITENDFPNAEVFFEKADGTITDAYPMSYMGKEEVDGNFWFVFAYDIQDDILNISEKVGDNFLKFSFKESGLENSLNTQPISIKCAYSINGQLPQLEQSDYENVISMLNLSLMARDENKVFHVDLLPAIADGSNTNFTYIIDGNYISISTVPDEPLPNKVYLWTGEDTETFKNKKYYRYKNNAWVELTNYFTMIGSVYVADGKGGYTQIAYGSRYVDSLEQEILSVIDEKDLNIGDEITSIKGNIFDLEEFATYADNKINELSENNTNTSDEINSIKEEVENKSTVTFVEWS